MHSISAHPVGDREIILTDDNTSDSGARVSTPWRNRNKHAVAVYLAESWRTM